MSKSKSKKTRFSNDVVIENRKARYDYEVIETFEAGIELSGNEVKSLRQGTANLTDVYAHVRGSQVFLRGMHIKPYEEGDALADPIRERRLLLHRNEIDRLLGSTSQKGLTVIPLKVYFNKKGWAKVLIGLCRGKKAHDKRETIKERDVARELQRSYRVR